VFRDYQSTDISVYITNIIASIVLGLFSGTGAVVFHFLLKKMQLLFEPPYPQTLVSRYVDLPVLLFFIPVLGALITAGMTWLMPDVARQRGVVSVIKSIMLRNGFIPIKVTLFHLLAPIISIGTGVPLGPEGPAAQIGSGMGSWMAQIFRFNAKDMRMYAAAGGGAAIAAVFNAPIAGVFFGIEVILLNDLKNTPLSALIISSVVADIFSRSILGTHHVFAIPAYNIGSVSTYHPGFCCLA
jgi:CIC family chloride channel protein